jgi:hypothetical protein
MKLKISSFSSVRLSNPLFNAKNQDKDKLKKNWFQTIKQGCQMVYFQTKNPNLGKFYVYLVYFIAAQYILWSFGIHTYFVVKWVYFSSHVLLYQEISGNPGSNPLSKHIHYWHTSITSLSKFWFMWVVSKTVVRKHLKRTHSWSQSYDF